MEMPECSPWQRGRPKSTGSYQVTRNSFQEQFDDVIYANMDLDVETKIATLKIAPSVVSLVSYRDGKEMFMASGTITESFNLNGKYTSDILTSASLLRSPDGAENFGSDIKVTVILSNGTSVEGHVGIYDFHFNFAIINIQSDSELPTAVLRPLDDSLSLVPSSNEQRFVLHRHSPFLKIKPGNPVVAVGRYFKKEYDLMAAPGQFSADSCGFSCEQLLRANCLISKCGIGGPLINLSGEVIGVNFYDQLCTPFLPVNIISKCLEHHKKYGEFFRPSLGMELTNLYSASLDKVEKIIQKFPFSEGVFVEEVCSGSPADLATIQPDDVIVLSNGKIVRSVLEFFSMVLGEAAGKCMEVCVLRGGSDSPVCLNLTLNETSEDNYYSWPLPEEYVDYVDKLR